MRVRIKTWDEMIEEYGRAMSTIEMIDIHPSFTRKMEDDMPQNRIITITPTGQWLPNSFYTITEEMIAEKATENYACIDGKRTELSDEDVAMLQKVCKEKLTYEDVAKSLFTNKDYFYTDANAFIGRVLKPAINNSAVVDANTASTPMQLERMLAFNKLMNVAGYLNAKKSLKNPQKVTIRYNATIGKLAIIDIERISLVGLDVIFKSEEDAQQAIDILGNEYLIRKLFQG